MSAPNMNDTSVATRPLGVQKGPTGLVKLYLVTYNILSTIGWAYVLLLTVIHVLNLDGRSEAVVRNVDSTASSILSRLVSEIPFFKSAGTFDKVQYILPRALQPALHRSTTTFARVGALTAFVQSGAVLEVLNVLVGIVRSPLPTTLMQVSSRLFLVWGVLEQYPSVRSNPLFTSMVLAWSMTEVIRYPFYACNLLSYNPSLLLYLRYTTFYILYPLGASSEALLIYATLPASSSLYGLSSWINGMHNFYDYVRAFFFIIWWPGLYIMYTHMLAQRRKTLGKTPRAFAQKKRD